MVKKAKKPAAKAKTKGSTAGRKAKNLKKKDQKKIKGGAFSGYRQDVVDEVIGKCGCAG